MIAPPDILEPLRRRLAVPTGCVDAGNAGYSATIRVTPDAGQAGYFIVEQDARPPVTIPGEAIARHLEWLIHAVAVGKLRRRYLLLHAGAVAWREAGILLCASSGSGKSTLTAGLVAAGCDYLGDEIAALDPAALQLQPYPRPICIKAGSRLALAGLYPQLAVEPPERRSDGEEVWYLQPPARAWRTQPVAVRQIIFPVYRPGARTEVAECAPAAALERLTGQSFSGAALGPQALPALVRLVTEARCWLLTSGSLDAGVAAVLRLARA